jgi:hypothetical protein
VVGVEGGGLKVSLVKTLFFLKKLGIIPEWDIYICM